MKILLGDFNANVVREDILKLIFGNENHMKPVIITGSE
jgi:hypothetical protein